MLPWLLPLGLLGSVVFVVVFDPYASIAAAVLGLLLVPVIWRARFASRGEDDDTNYWRLPRL